jgi:16S rRNA G966 N2-methylase RsmD
MSDGDISLSDLPSPTFDGTLSPDDLHTDGDNPNEMTDEQFGLLCDRMRENGWLGGPIITDADGLIADGEHRWRAAQEIGLSEVPVRQFEIDDSKRRLWRQELNKIHGEHDSKRDALEYDHLLQSGYSEEVEALTDAAGEDLDELLDELKMDTARPAEYEYDPDHNVYFEDCVEGMRERLADDSVNLVLADPPYGIDSQEMSFATDSSKQSGAVTDRTEFELYDWDDEPLSDAALDEIFRVGETVALFGGNYIADRLPPSSGWVAWDKTGGMTSNDFADTELIWTNADRPARIYRHQWRGMFTDSDETRYHPTQKPVAVMEWLITEFTDPGDTVLDPFMGSGTTAVAAIQNDRDYVGFELDADNYRDVIERRIGEAKRQTDASVNQEDSE